MDTKISIDKKFSIALIGLGIVAVILIAAVLISFTTRREAAWSQNFMDDNVKWSQEITEDSIHRSGNQIEVDIQNSLVRLDEHIKESQRRLDEHVQYSKERFEKLVGKD